MAKTNLQRAGQPAQPNDLIDLDALIEAYYSLSPDPDDPTQAVAFGTSGHRGRSTNASFNEDHILATTQAIVDYRAQAGITGPLFVGRDTHALSDPAQRTAVEVLAANRVETRVAVDDGFTPTPAVSLAIIAHPGSDGIVVTPSHNPPSDGGFKYNATNGGPADADATGWIADRANDYLRAHLTGVSRIRLSSLLDAESVASYDFRSAYVSELEAIIDFDPIRSAGVRIGADPMGGASVEYWGAIAETYGIDLTVVNPAVDPRWAFMTLDWDGKIRMDCSSPSSMASLIKRRSEFDLLTGNDADADRHGIVTSDHGLMNPNHYLAVAIDYLFGHRPEWGPAAAIGKTLVSSSMIDRVAGSLGRRLHEVPVGFKWFVPGLSDGRLGFGGEESAGASFLRRDGSVWTTDKDGLVLCLLAAEMTGATGQSPSERYWELTDSFGDPAYARIDAPATRDQKAVLGALRPDQVRSESLAGETITAKLTEAPGNRAPIGGLKVTTENAWFAARPSGTEDVYKIYAESFLGPDHLADVQDEARQLVSDLFRGEHG